MKVIKLLLMFSILIVSDSSTMADTTLSQPTENLIQECEESETNKPPFYVSDEFKQNDRLWENFRSIKDPDDIIGFIPRGSIVYAPPELTESTFSPDDRVPVRVISIFDETRSEIANARGPSRKMRPTSLTPRGRELVEKGQEGFLDRRAMQPAGKYTFFVKKDSPLHRSMGGSPNLANLPLTLKVEDGKYKGQRCCIRLSPTDEEPQCHFRYSFETLAKDGETPEVYNINVESCRLMESVVPVQSFDDLGKGTEGFDSTDKELGHAVNNILLNMRERYPGFGIGSGFQDDDVEFGGLRFLSEHRRANNSATLEREYMMKIPIDHETKKGPYNSIQYNPDDNKSNDAFLRPVSMCAFMEVLKKFEKSCGNGPDCRVQFGNMYHHRDWNVHQSHGDGTCVDIRPMRTDPDNIANGLVVGGWNYDREKTRKLVNVLREAGGDPLYLNDSKIKGSDSLSGHNNHIHVCFNPRRRNVKETCEEGIN